MMPPAVFAPVGISNVVLTSTAYFQLASHPLNQLYRTPNEVSLGLVTINRALRERGFSRTTIFAPFDKPPDIETEEKQVIDGFKLSGADEKGAVIGISTFTDEQYKFEPLSRLLRAAFPGARIIAGGQHFVREKINGFADTVETVLAQGLADAVQVGHAEGFVDFVTGHNGKVEPGALRGFYALDPDSGRVLGSGKGRFPALSNVPYYFDANTKSIDVLLQDSCPNRCEFCSAPLNPRHRFKAALAAAGLAHAFAAFAPHVMELNDPDPFEEKDFDYYDEIFDALDRASPTLKSVYLNPASLVSDEHRARLVDFFIRHSTFMFHLGRDVVVEENARHIGSRYHGRVKTQSDLDAEGEAIMAFVRAMKAAYPLLHPQLSLAISYIITPFETAETFSAMIDDLVKLSSLIGEKLQINFGLFPLMPYPGTKVREKFIDRIVPGEFDFLLRKDGAILPWKKGMGPNISFVSNGKGVNAAEDTAILRKYAHLMEE